MFTACRRQNSRFDAGCNLQELYPGNFKPTPAHHFMKVLHDKGILQRCYTQNIDSLESQAGLPADKVIAAHGNFDTARCIACKEPANVQEVKASVDAGEVRLSWSLQARSCTRCRHNHRLLVGLAAPLVKLERNLWQLVHFVQMQAHQSAHAKQGRRQIGNGGVQVHRCGACEGVIKPDIVFFGENLPVRSHVK